MNRKELVRRIAGVMRDNDIRKPISAPRKVFHISDDDGNCKDFVVKRKDRGVLFTTDDVESMIDACLFVIEDAIKHGEPISIRGFGTLGLKYRKKRGTKNPITNEWVDVEARYVPKFTFGNDLRMCAKVYELSLQDKMSPDELPIPDDDDDELSGGDE